MHEDNLNMITQYQEGRKELLGAIVESNQGLIHTALKSFKWAYAGNPKFEGVITYEDLFQEGAIGLCKSLDLYNPEFGAFSTYAMSWIKQAVFRYFYDSSRLIRVPYEPWKAFRKLKIEEEKYIRRYEKEPTNAELSAWSGLTIDDIVQLRKIFHNPVSIDAPIGGAEDDAASVGDNIPDQTDYIEGPERKIVLQQLRKDLVRMAENVLKDDEKVGILFYYFDNLEKKMVKEIAAECNVTSSKLQRLITDAIMKITRRYLDELIENYSDVLSSSVRRTREADLRVKEIHNLIWNAASSLFKTGERIKIIPAKSDSFRNGIDARIEFVGLSSINVIYQDIEPGTGSIVERKKTVFYQDIFDFRTSNKLIVEILCRWLTR